jgi:hypothetical protein
MPLSGWSGVQGGQGGQDKAANGCYSFKAKDLSGAAKKLGDKGPPLIMGDMLFYSKKQSAAGMLFKSDSKKWTTIRVVLNGHINSDFGPSCIAKIMDLPKDDQDTDIVKIAESLENKQMIFRVKITNMGSPYENAQIIRKVVPVRDSPGWNEQILFDDIKVMGDKSDKSVYVLITREGTDPEDTFEGTFSLRDIEVILPEILYESEEAKKVAKIKEEAAVDLKQQLTLMNQKLQNLQMSVDYPEIPPKQEGAPFQASPATLAEVLKNCDMATLQKLKQLGILQLESKQAPVFGDPLSPPAVIEKPSGVPLGKMGGRKVDLT